MSAPAVPAAGLGQPRGRWRRWLVVAGVVPLAVTGVAVAGLAWGGGGARHDPRPPRSRDTAPVQRMTLVASRTFTGTLGYGDATAVPGRLPGTVTDLAPVGAVLRRGDVVYRVDNQPVVLMLGTLPPYRHLTAGTVGPDVRQFKENLKAMGYTGFTVDDKFTAATVAAVKWWQKKLGLPETGTVEVGRVLLAAYPLRVTEHKVKVGDAAPVGAAVFTASPDARSVTIDLEDKDRHLAKTGTTVAVQLPSGRTTDGVMATVDAGGQNQGANGGTGGDRKTRVVVSIADQAALAGVDSGQVTVVLVTGERRDVLAVPIVALLATDDGYGVEVVTGASRRVVPVTIGLFAMGKVEISGPGLAEGMLVGVPSR